MTITTPAPLIQKTKQHFEILDGLRGIAAATVVVFHFMEIAYSDFSTNFIAHGFLAVDFFFCLSGFVIAYAYDQRMPDMGIIEFLKARLIRLHPLVILGSVLGLLAFLLDPFGGQPEVYSAGKTALIFICSVLMIPYPVMEDRGFNLFGLNAPSWSLFWEYIANICYAIVLYRIKKNLLWVLTILAAVLLSIASCRSGNLLGGWGGTSFWDGGARVCYSFLAGMLVYRSNLIIKSKLGFGALTILLMLSFLMPFTSWNWVTEPLVVIIYFPLLVSLGAGAVVSPRLKSICNFSGQISYPLYMTHYAVIWMFLNYYTTHKPGTVQLTGIIVSGLIMLTGIAYLAMRFYDIPVRRYFDKKRKEKLARKI
jgi:peptidoglycan/LPS O-acetylase OafA/YrhL